MLDVGPHAADLGGRAPGGVSAGSVDHRAEVYDAEPGTLLDLVRRTPDEVGCLLLVGHAPGVPRLVEELVPADAPDPMPDGCPTSGFAVLRFDGGWGDLGPGGAELVEFVVARGELSPGHQPRPPSHALDRVLDSGA